MQFEGELKSSLKKYKSIDIFFLYSKSDIPCRLPSLSSLHSEQVKPEFHMCVQMAAEGLTMPDDFEDFPEKEDLEGLFKKLLKPAKTPGLGANTLPQELATFVIPAKSMIHMHGVRKIVLYYKMVGRMIEPGDLL